MKETVEKLIKLRSDFSAKANEYQPFFFRLNNSSDLIGFNKLLNEPGISVCDEIQGQVNELIKLRNPTQKLTEQTLFNLVQTFYGDTKPEAYGVWVFYPWSMRLVHLLDKDEFIELRTSRNQYKITPEERDILANKKVGVIGLSVGQSVSVTMAMERVCGELRLTDFDRLELSNLNRIRTGVHNLGLLKVYSVAREIAELDPFIKVVCFEEGLSEKNMDTFFLDGGKLDLLVEESDGFDIKILSRHKARELKVPVIMEASDRCMVDVERFDLEPDRKILHGILDHLSVEKMKTLTTNEEKIPYMFDILGIDSTSSKLRASMLEMQQTITTWPQLASAVTMGGGITADVSRRILLNTFKSSGRYYVDIDVLIGDEQTQTGAEVIPISETRTPFSEMEDIIRKSNIIPSDTKNSELSQIVEAASKAPSFANEQPWLWLAQSGSLCLFASREPSQIDLDFKNQLLYGSLGAAIENAKQEALSLGLETKLTFPKESDSSLIAMLSFNRTNNKTNHLASVISTRCTSRAFEEKSLISEAAISSLMACGANDSSAEIQICTNEEQILNLAAELAAVEAIKILHPQTHKAYFSQELIIKPASFRKTGVQLDELGLPAAMKTAMQVVSDPKVAAELVEWQRGTAFMNYYKKQFSLSAAIGIVKLKSTAYTDLLLAGMLSERIWLQATSLGMAFHPICVPLTLLKHFEEGSPVTKQLKQTQANSMLSLKKAIEGAFGPCATKEGVFLFRIGKMQSKLTPSLRKPLSEIYFCNQHSSV